MYKQKIEENIVTMVLLLILCAGFEVNASDLDNAFANFLSSSLVSKSYEDHSIAVKNLYKLYENEFIRSSMTSDEENLRFTSFSDTILTLLKDHQQDDKTYTVGLNKYADLDTRMDVPRVTFHIKSCCCYRRIWS
jgi:hypothetical protein